MKKKKDFKFELPPIGKLDINNIDYEYGEMPFDPKVYGFELEPIGLLKTKKSIDIESSPIGIGYEVLDRDAYDFTRSLAVMKDSGVKWARVQSGWNKTEKTAGVYDFAWLDEIVYGLLDAGITPWISVSYGNSFYTPTNDSRINHGYAHCVPLHYGEEAVEAWEKYCSALAKHYKDKILYWEVWNEPNVGFWGQSFPSPAEYAELVKITSQEIKKIIPDAKIIGGSISGANCCNKYINGLVNAGICDYIDIFTYHPYGTLPEVHIKRRFDYIKAIFDKYNIPIWQGECGRPSSTTIKGRGYKLTLANQARYVLRRIITDLELGFEMISYFSAGDFNHQYLAENPNDTHVHHHQGVIETVNYTAKPAFKALQSMATLFSSETKKANLCFAVYPPDRVTFKLCSMLAYNASMSSFKKGNIPLYSYYLPENIDLDTEPKHIDLQIWLDEDEVFENPILIDPMTQKVYKINNNIEEQGLEPYLPSYEMEEKTDIAKNEKLSGRLLFIKSMPLLDYPLFVTDISFIQE